DISASLESVQEIASASRGIIPLRYESFINENEVLKVVEQVHTNRLDPARDVIRSVESREGNKVILQPMQAIARKKGSITIDN
ncbi:phospho-sugar glycosidase domain-containing protein, partial [Bacillus pseudomycoides]